MTRHSQPWHLDVAQRKAALAMQDEALRLVNQAGVLREQATRLIRRMQLQERVHPKKGSSNT